MNKNLVFFGEEGLTSTSANHVANMAKEFVREIQNELSSISFVNSSVSLIGNSCVNELSVGVDFKFLSDIPGKLKAISDANSLIAWLREGISAKEDEIKRIERTDFDTWLKDIKHVEIEASEVELASCQEDDIIGEMSIGERCKYYALQAEASTIGKFIHNSGAYEKAREEMNLRLSKPREVKGEGQDTLIYAYGTSVASESVEDMFFSLQSRYREVQAELNGMAQKIKDEVTKRSVENRNAVALRNKKYAAEMAPLSDEYSVWSTQETDRISKLKIIIPKSLKDIYECVNKLGK